jgi:hypothetical protein
MLTRIMLLLGIVLAVALAAVVLGGKWLTNYFAATGDVAMLRVLLAMNPKWANERIAVSPGSTLSETPMASAFLNGNTEAAILLLERGADPNLDRALAARSLEAAIQRADIAALEAYGKAGGKPTEASAQFAARMRDGNRLLRILVPPRCAVGDPSLQRDLSLSFLSYWESDPPPISSEAIQIIVDAGADLESPEVVRALVYYLVHGKGGAGREFLARGASPWDHDFRFYGPHAAFLEGILSQGASIEQVTRRNGKTPLLIAAGQPTAEFALLLVERGANVRATVPMDFPSADAGSGALHFAAARGHAELVRALLAAGADPLAANAAGKTPLELAANDDIREVLRDAIAAAAGPTAPEEPAE